MNRPNDYRRPAAALLEVVVSLGLFVMALAMIGAAFVNSNQSARKAVERSRALMLTEQVVTYFDTGQFKEEREVSGAFGVEGPPGWGWSLKRVKDPNVEGLDRVTIQIVEGDPEGAADEKRPILVTDFLRAEKKNLNLAEDFGLTEEQLEKLTEAIPGGAAVLDPTDFDPTSLARMDMDTLSEMLPLILESLASLGPGGLGGGALGGLPGGVSADKVLEALGGDAGSLGALQGPPPGAPKGAPAGGPTGGGP